MNGRAIHETLDLVHFSPEVRAIRKTQVFANGRVPLLYSFGLSEPALRFYLADQVQSVGENELAQIIVRSRRFLSRARPIEAEKRSLPGTDPTATLVVVGTLRQLLELSRSRYPRTREKCRTTLRYLRTGNTELAKRPFVPVPISIDGYIATR